MNNWVFLHEGGVLYWHYNPTTIFILLVTALNSLSNILRCDYLNTDPPTPIQHKCVICIDRERLTLFKCTKYFLCMVHRAIDNALPSALSKNDHKHQKHLLSKINCGKELKENNRANLTTNKDAFQLKLEETQKLLEDQHLSSLQV